MDKLGCNAVRSLVTGGAIVLATLPLAALCARDATVLAASGTEARVEARATSHSSGFPLETPAPTGRIIVKFREATGFVVRDGELEIQPESGEARISPPAVGGSLRERSAGPQSAGERAACEEERAALGRRLERLAVAHGELRLERHFSRPSDELERERRQGERRSGRALPDLNRYARIVPARSLSLLELRRVVADLRADPAIEIAFLEPVAVPAALGFDAFTGRYGASAGPSEGPGTAIEPAAASASDPGLPTPDFTSLQLYLDPAPAGVDAEGVWGLPGGRGQSVKVLDVEGAWLWAHEDLPEPFHTAGGEVEDLSWRNHGTAVLGEIRGAGNAYGVTGIGYECQVGGVSVAELSVADAINNAAAHLDPGDVFLIELHSPGPNATGVGQYGYVCMEYWLDNFEAIQIATANGRVCCEAAGNGEQDLDDPVYLGLFDRNVRDSGAILVGASNGQSLEPAGFTNYGSRVDLHGWGYSVVTCGYGNLQGGDETQWYTSSFSGTSSATPIVTGAVVALQGLVETEFGISLNAKLARDLLVETGTPQEGTRHIGPRPDLTAAWTLAQQGIGAVAGTVTEAGTVMPLAGVTVTAAETGAFTATDEAGHYSLPLRAGAHALSFAEFFHAPATSFVSVASGTTTACDVGMSLLPTVTIGGTTTSTDGVTPLSGMRVTPWGVPFPAIATGTDGAWAITGLPEGHAYAFLFDGLPGFGADYAEVDVPPGGSDFDLLVQIPPAAATFESSDGGFTGDPIWEYGVPTAGLPSSGFSGERCWGVGLHANYDDGVHGYLTSPSYDFANEIELRLSFHYWCETESNYDGAAVDAWDAALGEWVRITPLTGYPSMALGGIDYQNGWSGSTGGWEGAVFDLTPFLSDQVAFRVEFGSDQGVNGLGFWIDDVAFDTGDAMSNVAPPAGGTSIALFTRGPHPFAGAMRLAFVLPRSEEVEVAVFDPAGRRVRSLQSGRAAAGTTEIAWDARDERGFALGSGVYFVRLRTEGEERVKRIVLAR